MDFPASHQITVTDLAHLNSLFAIEHVDVLPEQVLLNSLGSSDTGAAAGCDMCFYIVVQYSCGHSKTEPSRFCAAASHFCGTPYPCSFRHDSDGVELASDICRGCRRSRRLQQQRDFFTPRGDAYAGADSLSRGNCYRMANDPNPRYAEDRPFYRSEYEHSGMPRRNPTYYRKPGHLGAANDYERHFQFIDRL